MKKSIWFQEYEKEVQGKRKKSNQGKKVALFVPPVMLVLVMVAVLANGGATDPQARTGMLCMLDLISR